VQAWDEEIKRGFKELEEVNQKKLQEAAEEAAIAQSVAASLEGLISQARSGDDVIVEAIPVDVRVASTLVGGPSVAALNTLIAEISSSDHISDRSQRSAAWALT